MLLRQTIFIRNQHPASQIGSFTSAFFSLVVQYQTFAVTDWKDILHGSEDQCTILKSSFYMFLIYFSIGCRILIYARFSAIGWLR